MFITYLNTDLELESPVSLDPIVRGFGQDVITMFNGRVGHRFRASFELAGVVDSPDSIIQHFCMFAESLDDEAAAVWNGCHYRLFDIGYGSASGPQSYCDDLRPGTIARMAALNAGLRITVYPSREKRK